MKLPKINAKFILILVGLVLVVGWFYWYEWRPAKIRQDCSWVKKYGSERILREDLSEEERAIIKAEPKSNLLESYRYEKVNNFDRFYIDKPVEYWAKANDEEYKSCIREKGLK